MLNFNLSLEQSFQQKIQLDTIDTAIDGIIKAERLNIKSKEVLLDLADTMKQMVKQNMTQKAVIKGLLQKELGIPE